MANDPNIVYLLLWHLNQYNWFELPGIGRFNGTKRATYIHHIEQKIYPGTIDLQFESGITSNTEQMLSHMVEETGYSLEVLEEHLAALCQYIEDSFKSAQSFYFEPFGRLYNLNGNWVFKQSEHNIHQAFYKMSALPLKPIQFKNEEKQIPIETKVAIQTPKKSYELRSLLIALGILWLIFICLYFCPNRKSNSEINKWQQEDTTSVAQPLSFQDSMDRNAHTADSIAATVQTPISNPDSLSNEVQVNESNVDHLNDSIQNKPCVIIVGSFLKINNANRLTDKLKREQYEVYHGQYEKFNRVGVKFDCFKQDLKKVLDDLKKQYHPDAWVLKY